MMNCLVVETTMCILINLLSIEDGGNFDLAWAHLKDLTLDTAFTPPPVSVPRKSAKSF